MQIISLVLIVLNIVIYVHSTTKFEHDTTLINLQIEGDDNTIFENTVSTKGGFITTESGGTHECDGTNHNASTTPGPTPTCALNTAAKDNGFTWDGTFDESFDDFFIRRIANISQTKKKFWGIYVNYQPIAVGGCQQKLPENDHVLFAFDAFAKKYVLKLQTTSVEISIDQPITVTVTDGTTGEPISNATVHNQQTDSDGHAEIIFRRLGTFVIKAERSDSTRSNGIKLFIKP